MSLTPALPRLTPSPVRGLGPAWLLLGVATIGLLALQALPRAGLPVLVVFPPGLGPDRALAGLLAVPGWDPAMVRAFGPFAVAIAAPADSTAESGTLRRGSGAWLTLSAPGRAACMGRIG